MGTHDSHSRLIRGLSQMFELMLEAQLLLSTATAFHRAPSELSPGVSGSSVIKSGDAGDSASSASSSGGSPRCSSSRFRRRKTDLFSKGLCSFAWRRDASEMLSRWDAD